MQFPWKNNALNRVNLSKNPTSKEELLRQFTTEEQRDQIDIQAKMLFNIQFENEIRLRENFATGAFFLTLLWVIFLMIISALEFYKNGSLSDHQFTVIFTSTTISVLGFWGLVGRYLFHRSK